MLQNKKANCFIIIVTHNGIQWLSKCLESTKCYSTVVIDNCSSDNTVDFIIDKYPDVILLPQNKNLGFGKANNIGISYALQEGADYVFLLNQDAYLEEGTVENLMAVHRSNPEFGILSPIHLNGTGDNLDQNFSNYLSYRYNSHFYSDFILNKEKEEIYEVPFVNAAGWLIFKKCIEIIGGFDPIFKHYGEDDNYCQRVRYHGLKIGVVPKTFIRHDREKRVKNKTLNQEEYLERQERFLKIKYADINKEFYDLNRLIKKRKRAKLKSFCKLDLASVKYYGKEISLLNKISAEISSSRNINKRRGLNYLIITP